MDERIKKLAHQVINYACRLQEGERILITYDGQSATPFAKQLVKEAYAAKGLPFVDIRDTSMSREIMMHCTEEQVKIMMESELLRMKEMDAYISIRAMEGRTEMADVPAENQAIYSRTMMPVQTERVNNTKWAVLRYPNGYMSQQANMSREAFEDFYFNVCTVDYDKMSKAMDALVELIEKTNHVHIIGPGTDLEFSIEGMGAVKCDGKRNIPDGEVYTAPIRNSMNGTISYNTTAVGGGVRHENIVFEIKEGKIVNATSSNTAVLNRVLDTDEGARYFGEFSFGLNPYILTPMGDTLFDEKICGSFHLTPGQAYAACNNGNKSAIHWDLVNIQRPEYGGGEIWFDGKLIRKDGLFVIPELECLNPENLK